MTVTLHLTPDVEADLQAQEKGLTIEDYLLALIERSGDPASDAIASTERAEAVARMIEFGDMHRLSLGEPTTRSLLHEDHRF